MHIYLGMWCVPSLKLYRDMRMFVLLDQVLMMKYRRRKMRRCFYNFQRDESCSVGLEEFEKALLPQHHDVSEELKHQKR